MSALKGIDEALALLEAQVEKKGADFVYVYPLDEEGEPVPDCQYRDEEGNPSCIVGYVAADLGILPALMEGGVAYSQSALREAFSPEAREVLTMAQNAQDHEKTWGLALRAARIKAASLR